MLLSSADALCLLGGHAAPQSPRLRYDVPCYRGVLPRPLRSTARVSYVLEAQDAGITARTVEQDVEQHGRERAVKVSTVPAGSRGHGPSIRDSPQSGRPPK